nr:peptidoglycan-binding domain-containing protein [Streptacidiphilus sp. PB12-B1b]
MESDFGPLTFAAVENYQGSHGLSVDGIVGPDTKAALTGSATSSNPAPPSAGIMQSIVSYATAIENGHAEKGWSGGHIPYGWDGGHGAAPGPSPANCNAAGGDNDCWVATQNGTIGRNGQTSRRPCCTCRPRSRPAWSSATARCAMPPGPGSGTAAWGTCSR